MFADETTKAYGVGAVLLSIRVYVVTLHPILRRLDALGRLRPQGYSRTLGRMVGAFRVVWSLALVVHCGVA